MIESNALLFVLTYLAQLVEHMPQEHDVTGSNPVVSPTALTTRVGLYHVSNVAPFVGAWIEIGLLIVVCLPRYVARTTWIKLSSVKTDDLHPLP